MRLSPLSIGLPGSVLVLLAACGSGELTGAPLSAPPKTAAFDWPVPAGWKAETIPFPLDFAPELPYRGIEEIRFAPHFFDAKADTYFSYSFAWVLDSGVPVAGDRLGADLESYFFGLAQAVGADKHATYARNLFAARVEAPDATRYRGSVKIVDAFGDGRAVALSLDAESRVCGEHRVLLVTLSPRPVGDAIWTTLLEQRRTFRCAT